MKGIKLMLSLKAVSATLMALTLAPLATLTVTQVASANALNVHVAGLYNTGVNDDGLPLPAGAPDEHYVLNGPLGEQPTVTGNLLPSTWVDCQTDACWIRPNSATDPDNPVGTYTFSLSFQILSAIPEGFKISGLLASDNDVVSIAINGIEYPNSILYGFTELQPFELTENFISGYNTLQFVVNNMPPSGPGNNPTGLIVSGLSATACTSFIVNGTDMWQNTGIQLNRGDPFQVTATGVIKVGAIASAHQSTPDGCEQTLLPDCITLPSTPDHLCPSLDVGYSLVGKIGSFGECFFVGSDLTANATDSGELWLAFNDNVFFDNKGSFTTCISVGPIGPIAHAFCEIFDEYALGSKGAPAWYDGAGNTSGVAVDNTTAFTGTQSYKMFGLLGSCWGAIMYHDLALTYPFSVEVAVKNGTENLTGCHPYHASMEFKLGTKWWDPGVTGGFYFRNNGDFNPGVSGTEAPISGFALDQWHIVRGEYSTPGDDSLHVKYWVNDIFVGEFTAPEPTQAPLYLGIAAQEGTVWFDDICVTPDTFSLYVDHVPMDALPGNCSNAIEVDAPVITDDTWQTTEASEILSRENPLSGRQATITIAIPGSAELDVTQLDGPVTRLQGRLPLSGPVFKDVTGPGPCDGSGADGILDAVYTYDLNKVLKSFGAYKDGDELTLSLVGQLTDGQPLDAKDKITVHIKDRERTINKTIAGLGLGVNYPNPFNPSTKIGFTLTSASQVTIEVFNVMGQRVKTLADAEFAPGQHSVTWESVDENGVPVASGMYFYRMNAGAFTQTQKMVLLK